MEFIQQTEFTTYNVKMHPNAATAETASAQRETAMVDALEFTRVQNSAEFDREPRPDLVLSSRVRSRENLWHL
jgi:hypothetical protein